MKILRLKVTLLFIIFSISFVKSQENNNNQLIPVNKLQEDVDILKTNLEAIHAGLYNHSSKEEIDKQFTEIKSKIIKPLSSIEFYRRIVSLHKYIKNGHTIIIPSEEFDNSTGTTTAILPIDVYWYENAIYVLRNNSNNLNLPIGAKIESINGQSASKLFLELADKWTRDGSNTTFPEGITQRAFSGFYINLIGSPETYTLVYQDSTSNSNQIVLKALTNPEIEKNRKKRYGDIHYYWQKDDGDAVTLELNGNTALLKIKTCANSDIRKFGRSIKGIMKSFFREMRENNIEHLIVDLRDNGGGDEIISRELFRHISKKPFVLFKDSYLITKKIPNKELYNENVGKMNTFATIGLYKGKDGFYRLNGLGRLIFRASGRLKEQKPYKTGFEGKIYTLTNAYSFSAAGEIASSMKTNTNSVFIGEEPGGNTTKLVAGEIFTLVLPHSKNRVRIPVVNQLVHTTAFPSDRGVLPDYEVRNNIDDIISGKDAVLEFTYDLIKKDN